MKFLAGLFLLFSVAASADQVVLNGREVTLSTPPGQSFDAVRNAGTPAVVTLHFAPHQVAYEVCDQYEYYRYVCGHTRRCYPDPQHEGRTICYDEPTYCTSSRCISSHTEWRTEYQNLTMNFKRSLPLNADQKDTLLVSVYSYSDAGVSVASSVNPYKIKQGGTIFNGHSWYFAQGDQEPRH